MQYYQTDFLSNPPMIARNSVDLFISSVPLQILAEETGLLFGILNRFMKNDGIIIFDTPVGDYNMTMMLSYGSGGSRWTKLSHHVIPNLYHDDKDQIFHIYYKMGSRPHICGVNRKVEIERKRPKAHPCEFCPDIISHFIEKYSTLGDTVLDAFCGTGTVAGEADRLGRHGIGCDLRPVENIRSEYEVTQ